MGKRTALLLGLLLLAAAPAAAQDDGALPATFTSDRPGFANSTGVAAMGRLTTELGATGVFDDHAPYGELPNLSLRFGLFEWLEGRVRAPNGVGDFGPDGPRFGLSDPWLGIKIGGRLHEQVSISSDIEVSLPLGTDGFGRPEAELFIDLNLDWRFFGPLTLTANGVVRSVSALDEVMPTTSVRYFDGGGSLKLSWSVIDVLTLFVQSYVLKSEIRDWRVQVGGGLAWMVAPNVQVDASFDIGVSDAGDPPTARLGTTILW